MSFRPVFHVVGVLISVLGAFMLVPAVVDIGVRSGEWRSFVAAAAVALFFGISLALATRGEMPPLTVRQTFLLTSASWVAACVFAAVPLALSGQNIRWVDALFEATSGLSTTGATVLVGLDRMHPGILLWRALLNWLGGLGMVVMAMVVLPFLRVGGMQLFRTESSDKADRPVAQARFFAVAITMVYVGLTTGSAALFKLTGMTWFDAVCHAMAAISTGGFSTHDASLGAFPNLWTLWAATASMIAGATPLSFYIRLFQRGRKNLDSQIITFLVILVVCIAAMTVAVINNMGWPFWVALSHAAVNVTSIITDCGLVSTDYTLWGSFAVAFFFFFYFIGGCTGSTTGSIKIYRWQILFLALRNQFLLMIHPHRSIVTVYEGKRVTPDVVQSVVSFVSAYILCFAVLSVALAATGMDFLSSTSAVATAMAGAGPGLGAIIGPAGTFHPIPDSAKLVLCWAMLLGRLEIFTLLVVLTPGFWRD